MVQIFKQFSLSFWVSKIFRFIYIIILIGCVSGCAMFKTKKVDKHPPITWNMHKQLVETINKWQLQGKVAFNDGQNAANASISWNNLGNRYKIRIYGPFGSNSVIIKKQRAGLYTLETSDGKVFKASSAESLMNDQLGWYVPIHGLTSWIKGVPVNYSKYKLKLNRNNQLFSLQQNNWKISYDNYKSINRIFLPTKLQFLNNNIKIKFIIKKWNLK